ncbi:MAG: hypothetical protein EA408_11450 [Marinilabiliales bacterium]|nr:MAG: hypothetical protein EA408_11450 [Marinilabiliales bacterium]
MEVTTFDIDPCEIEIDRKALCRLMGVDAFNTPEPWETIISREINQVRHYRGIRGGYGISANIEIRAPEGVFTFEGTGFDAGRQVVNNLRRAEMLALFICTAGEDVSRRSKEMMRSGETVGGYVADLVGSLLAEAATDIVHSRIAAEMQKRGLKVTNRYSPGYCNWPTSEQKKLFSMFPGDFCGVRLTESSLMVPVKSVSGVTGIGRDVEYDRYVCDACSDTDCLYRNTGPAV